MKSITVASVLILGLGLILAMPAVAQHAHEVHTAHAADIPVPTQRYTPDASLKKGMRRVRVALEELRHYDTRRVSETMTVDRANTVQEAVNYMFANCKLTPAPDAALHSMLVPLLSAAQALKAHPGDAKPVADMHAQVARYPRYFDDPGWQPVAHAQRAAHD